jgi:predicted DsbA family dithiol-disulfide isomerase
MFKAYFEDLDDIGQIETIVQAAEDVGLPGGELRQSLLDGTYRAKVDEGIAWSRGIGVTAIPTFVFNERYGMVGAQELPAFRAVMDKLGIEPKTPPEG